MKHILFVKVFLFLGMLPMFAQNPAPLTSQCSGDAMISMENITTNYGSDQTLFCGYYGVMKRDRSIIRFTMPSQIVSGSRIVYARMYLSNCNSWDDYTYPASPKDIELSLHKVTSAWKEGQVTWNNFPGWDSQTANALYHTTSPDNGGYSNEIINVKPFVEDWIANPSTNLGMVIKLAAEHAPTLGDYFSCDSREGSVAPYILISYVPAGSKIVRHVKVSSTGLADGGDWANAMGLQDAMFESDAGDEIWAQWGSYKPTHNSSGVATTGRDATFMMVEGVKMYGSFYGTETSLASRYMPNSSTGSYLDGNIGGSGNTDNSYHVITSGNTITTATLINGFGIRNGNANGSGSQGYGGGMYCSSSSPTFEFSSFENNTAKYGGAAFIRGSSAPEFINCVFRKNTGNYHAIDNFETSAAKYMGCLFVKHTITVARHTHTAAPEYINCTFAMNTNTSIKVESSSSPKIYNSIMWNPGSEIVGSTSLTVQNSIIEGGYANGTNIINQDPLFINTSFDPAHFLNLMDNAYGFDLQYSSPAMDMGNNSILPSHFTRDIANRDRIENLEVNIGAYEAKGCRSVLYVTPSGAGNQDGTSWSNAYPGSMLQNAINNVCAYSHSPSQIWVKYGTYYPTLDASGNVPADPRSKVFTMRNNVQVYGGFFGNETSLDDRNPAYYRTYLSGNIGSTSTSNDNCYHVVYANTDVTNTTQLTGFTIKEGKATGTSSRSWAGGLYNLGDLVVTECIFENNYALGGGGAVMNRTTSSQAEFNGCMFLNNTSGVDGGAIHNYSGASVDYINCVFQDNSANSKGGAMHNAYAGTIDIVNCTFEGNSSNTGGYCLDNYNSTMNVQNSIVWNGATVEIRNSGGTANVRYSDVYMPNGQVYTGTGNINSNPLFKSLTNLVGPDYKFMTLDDGLSINTNSPCMNSGYNPYVSGVTTDITGANRIMNTTVNMGAYEVYTSKRMAQNPQNLDFAVRNYPNPFQGSTTIELTLDFDAKVDIEVMDVTGKVVAKIAKESFGEGIHTFNFDSFGIEAGIYFCRVVAEKANGERDMKTLKMLLVD